MNKAVKILSPRVGLQKCPLAVKQKFVPAHNNKRKLNTTREKSEPLFFEPEQEFQQPEYLMQQKNTLLQEISQLKSEIKPLSDKFNKLQEKLMQNTSNESLNLSGTNPENNISTQLKQKHQENEILIEELAVLRRAYSQNTVQRLKFDIEYQNNMLSQLNSDTQELTEKNDKLQKELQEILDSHETLLIEEHKKQINVLKSTLNELMKEESQYIESYMSIISTVPHQNEQILAQKKSQLKTAEHQRMLQNRDLRALRREYEDRCLRLELQIADRENEIRKKISTDNWKSEQNKTNNSPNKEPIQPTKHVEEEEYYYTDYEDEESIKVTDDVPNMKLSNHIKDTFQPKEPTEIKSPQSKSPRVKFHESTIGHGIPLQYALENSIVRKEIEVNENNLDENEPLSEDELLDIEPLRIIREHKVLQQ